MKSINEMISYLFPILIEARNGRVSPYLEVRKYKGKYILNSQTVNYSYGGLHLIFDQLFQKISIQNFEFNNVLILGMGAGSIISLLNEKYGMDCAITAIEKDEVVIELAKKHFNIQRFKSLHIIHSDAFNYVAITENKYDLIISDLFIDGNVPEIFTSDGFLKNIKRISNEQCCFIYNKMTDHQVHKNEFINLLNKFDQIFPGSEIHKLYAYNSENSLLYYNTLPSSSKNLHLASENNSRNEFLLPNLKPTYGAYKS